MEDSISMTAFVWFGLTIAITCLFIGGAINQYMNLFIGGAINQYMNLYDARAKKAREHDEKVRSLEWRVNETYEQLNDIRRSISYYTSKLDSQCTPKKK